MASACGAADLPGEDHGSRLAASQLSDSNLQAIVSIERTRELLPDRAGTEELANEDSADGSSVAYDEFDALDTIVSDTTVGDSIAEESTLNHLAAGHAISGQSDATGTALAQFLVLPAELDPQRTLDWAGLKSNFPGPTKCWRPTASSGADRSGADRSGAVGGEAEQSSQYQLVGAITPVGLSAEHPDLLELLAAGDVSVSAGDQHTELALNFFPPSGSASGVLYSSRDRSAQPLPADSHYRIEVSGSQQVPALTIIAEAPAELENIRMEGEGLDAMTSFASGQPMAWTWSEGAAGDRVYIHLSTAVVGMVDANSGSSDEGSSVVCAFEDTDGAGTIPAEFTSDFPPDSSVRVGLHRIREILQAEELPKSRSTAGSAISNATLVETTMRFDFEYAITLRSD